MTAGKAQAERERAERERAERERAQGEQAGALGEQAAEPSKRMRDFDKLIFSPSDIPRIAHEKLASELASGLGEDVRAFCLEALDELSGRLSEQRFAHSVSVARTCRRMAEAYGLDASMCVRAGLVHDWDKCYKGEAVFDRAHELGVDYPEEFRMMSVLMHSITGAAALRRRFPDMEPEILQAVARHTSGAVNMTDLDIVVYVADMIEPLRTYGRVEPLRDMVGKVSLRELFAESFRVTVAHIVSKGRYLHPESARIWNEYVATSVLTEQMLRD